MGDNKITIENKINLDSPFMVLDYFNEVYKPIISETIRLYSNYYNLSKIHNNLISRDYYNLTLINLRKLFEPKMNNKLVFDGDSDNNKFPTVEYQLNFIQWINNFYEIFNPDTFDEGFNNANIIGIKKSIRKLKTVLQEFEIIHNDKTIINDGVCFTHPLKTRIYNYASKFVAHSIAKSTIEKWEYNNAIFVEDEELKNLIKIISKIEDYVLNLEYYRSNTVKMKYKDYFLELEDKMQKLYKIFVMEVNNIPPQST